MTHLSREFVGMLI